MGATSRKSLAGRLVLMGLLAGSCHLIFNDPAVAQSDRVALPEISVERGAPRRPPPRDVAISPTTVPTPSDEIASTVTVLTAPEIERTQRRTIPDLLNSIPGLHIVQSGSPGTLTAIFMRGTNSNHVKVLLDGMDIGDPSTPNGAIDLGHLTTMDLDRVEVLRGPQSGLYGADAIGGVISLTTKKGSGPAKATGMIEGGSFGTFNQAAGVSGSSDRINYAFNISHFQQTNAPVTPAYMVPPGGRATGNNYNNWTYSTRLGADLSEYLSFNFYGRYTEARLLYSNDDPNAFPGVTYLNQSTYRNRNFYGRGEAVVTLFDGRFVNVFGINRMDYRRSNYDPDPNTLTTFDGMRDKYDWRGTVKLMPGQTVVLGLERENQHATTGNVDAKTGNQAGFIELQSGLAKTFFLVANLRQDRHDTFGSFGTWRVAPALVLPGIETKFKATYGTGFKAPTLYQLFGVGPFGFVGNPALQPEQSRGYDAGFEQPLFNNRVRFGALYFRNDIKNLIDFDATFTTVVNVNQAVTSGAEAFVAATISDRLKTRVDYTRTITKNLTTDLELLRRPRHKYSWTTEWQPIERLSLASTVIYLGRWRDIDRADFTRKDGGGVMTVNLAANYEVDKRLTVFARADNLFDVRYENPLGWMQPGLGIFGGIRMTSR